MKNFLYIQNNDGFTMVELLITMSITAIVGIILAAILIQNQSTFHLQTAKINQGISMNNSITQINDSIRAAAVVKDVCPQPPCMSSYTSGNSVLVLAIPSINGAGDIIKDVYDYLVVTADSVDPKILRKYVFPDSLSSRKSENQVLTKTLSHTQFYYLDQNGGSVAPQSAKKINYFINQSELVGLKPQTSSGSGQISLRNY